MQPRIVFRADDFDSIVEALGLTTDAEKAAWVGTSAANLSRIRAGRAVGAVFIATVLLKLPKIEFTRLFRIEADQ
jgi:hypothetical protein